METIQLIFESITGNVFYMILAIALIILIGFGIVKKIFKLVLVMVICLAVYLGYIALTEGSEAMQNELNKIEKGAKEGLDYIKEGAKESVKKIKDSMDDKKP